MEDLAPSPPLPQNRVNALANFETMDRAVMERIHSENQMSEMEEEETVSQRIERLGRERPKAFKTLWAEIGFVFTISMSQVLTVSSFFLLRVYPFASYQWAHFCFHIW
jgi:hypothetical protein